MPFTAGHRHRAHSKGVGVSALFVTSRLEVYVSNFARGPLMDRVDIFSLVSTGGVIRAPDCCDVDYPPPFVHIKRRVL